MSRGALRPLRDYQSALDWLDSLIDLERLLGTPEAAAPTLDRMRALMEFLGDPHRSVPAIHITGTNGKGSTARHAVALLGACGLTAGGYTSPHIERVNDRISVSNRALDDESFAEAVSDIAVVEPFVAERLGERPNYFEAMAAAAFNWFASNAHVNVIEVGMGGRWDATNVVDAEVAVITNIGADHLEIIGPALSDVAREKAGIISPGAVVVCGETSPELLGVIERAGADAGAQLWRRGADWDVTQRRHGVGGQMVTITTPYGEHSEVFVPTYGAHQAANAAAALCAVEAFLGTCLDDDLTAAGFGDVTLPARFEILARQPLVVIDGAHNPAGAAALRLTLAETLSVGIASSETASARGAPSAGAPSARVPSARAPSARALSAGAPSTAEPAPGPSVLVIGANRPHDPAAFCEALGSDGFDAIIATAAAWPRAIPADEVAAALGRAAAAGPAESEIVAVGDVAGAMALARERAGRDGTVVVSGSLYVAAEARRLLCSNSSPAADGIN